MSLDQDAKETNGRRRLEPNLGVGRNLVCSTAYKLGVNGNNCQTWCSLMYCNRRNLQEDDSYRDLQQVSGIPAILEEPNKYNNCFDKGFDTKIQAKANAIRINFNNDNDLKPINARLVHCCKK